MPAVLDGLFLQPLLRLYSLVFENLLGGLAVGPRLIAFSIVLNSILLPVYSQMEARSRRGREIKARVGREVARLKRHFRGRERYFYVRTVYRQHGYHPISELLGSADLFLQILVFATVYRYLSGLSLLAGQSFGPVADLSRPDGLLGGVHLLPLLMTAINAAAVFTYVEEPGRRLQALALAGLFLLLLYGSASGLVLYWTTNNLFSLARNLVVRRVLPALPGTMTQPLGELARQQ
jgi:membrane protein insertase Oxa1/YidC/SpoIIIJ